MRDHDESSDLGVLDQLGSTRAGLEKTNVEQSFRSVGRLELRAANVLAVADLGEHPAKKERGSVLASRGRRRDTRTPSLDLQRRPTVACAP